MGKTPYILIRKLNNVKIVTQPRATYTFDVINIEILVTFFTEIEKNPKIHMES